MRITINIATPIFDELKRMQQRDGGTLGELVTGLLAEGIESRRRGRSDPAFTWISEPMRARVDLTDKDALAAQEGLERGPDEKTVPAVGDGDDAPLPDWQRGLIRDRLAALENVPPEERSVPWEAVRKRRFAGAK